MKTLLFILYVSVVGLISLSCNRFEARHEQIEAEDQPDVKDKTNVAVDTVAMPRPDTLVP